MFNLFGVKSEGPGFLGTGLSNNALMQAGLGLVGSANSSNPYAGLASGFQAGLQMDQMAEDRDMRREQFDLQKAEMERQARLDEEFNAYVTGRAPRPAAPPGDGLAGSGVDPNYTPPGLGGGSPPGLAGGIPVSTGLGGPLAGRSASMASIAATPGINPNVPGQSAPFGGILERIRNTPGGLIALRGLGREGASKFLLDQMVKGQGERKVLKGADGYHYYQDTGERVLPGVQVPLEARSQIAKIYQDIESGAVPRDVGMARIEKLNQPSQGITVNNMGNIPTGWQLVTDESTNTQRMEPIPGGPADQQQQQAAAAADAAKSIQKVKSDIVTEDLDRIFSLVQESPGATTGLGGAALSWLPGTNAHDISRISDTIKANLAFDKLNALRQASPTGGALGSVSAPELDLLKADLANLEQSQTRDQFLHALTRVKREYTRVVHGDEAAAKVKPYKLSDGGSATGNSAQTSTGGGGSGLAGLTFKGEAVTEADVEETMRLRGLTREQVLEAFRARMGRVKKEASERVIVR